MKIEICPGREYTRPEMLGNTENSGISNNNGNNGKGNLKELMRMAWLNHTYLLRMLLVSMAADLPDQQELVTALIDNAEEIADLFGRYYPEKYGAQPQRFTGASCRTYRWTDYPEKKKEERRIRWSRYAG